MKIAYVLTSIGALSHSFIRREVMGLRKLGVDISLYGVRPELSDSVTKPEERALYEETDFIYPLQLGRVAKAQVHFALRRPASYFRTFLSALLNEELSPKDHAKLIYHFFVSGPIAQAIEAEGAEHIHAHFMNVPASIAMYCSGLTGIPFSVTHHSSGIRDLPEMIGLKEKLRRAKLLCSISYYNRDYLDDIYPSADKNHVVRCGVDPDKYVGVDHSRIWNRDKIQLLSMGRFAEKKGFTYLVDACALLKADGVPFELRMIGSGPLLDDVKQQAERLGLAEDVVFLGPLPDEDLAPEFNRADIFVVPSVTSSTGEKEGIPGVITECMLLGVPIIATRHSGIPEHVIDRETGLLVSERAPQEIADAIKEYLADDELRVGCMKRGRELALTEFNIHHTLVKKKAMFEEYARP